MQTTELSYMYFNPLSPCGERHAPYVQVVETAKFQPTLPVWGETPYLATSPMLRFDFNPLSPCGERHGYTKSCGCLFKISTHSPRVGRDIKLEFLIHHKEDFNPLSPCGERPAKNPAGAIFYAFQPTLPVWGETSMGACQSCNRNMISTHSPRVGRD